jgi:hypothetical protein
MIEQYFRPGVRFLWNKPNDAADSETGELVVSRGAANPLSYDGLDGHTAAVDPTLLMVSGVLGLAMHANVPHAWLDYAPGRSSYVPLRFNDVLTGFMSGCPIVRGTTIAGMSAIHVGTKSVDGPVNSMVRRAFAQKLPADATGFNPAGAWSWGETATIMGKLGGATVAAPYTFALVTTGGAFYSILMFAIKEPNGWTNPAGKKYWCVGGKKLVPPLNRTRLMAWLLS